MGAKQIIGSLIFVVVLNICVNAQFLNFNTVSHNRPAIRGAQQQSNGRASRQQTFVVQQPQKQQQTRRQRPTQDGQIDTIIIVETEAETPKAKPTQRQPQRQQTAQNNRVNQQTQVQQTQRQPQRQQTQNQRPNQQNQAKAPQRQQTTNQQAQQNHRVTQQNSVQSTQRQPQRQQTQSQSQTQQNSRTTQQPQIQQHQQQQYQQQTQTQHQHQRPTHEDAPVIFPGSTNNPHRTTNGNSENFANNNFNSFGGGGAANANQAGFVPDNSFGASVGVGAVSDGFGGNNFNGNGINNFDNNPFFTGPTNGFDNNNSPVNNFDNGFVGAGVGGGGGGGPYDDNRWYNPHRPRGNYYRNFAPIFNNIDRKAENDYNTSEEDDEVNDDFNGRSVVSPGQYPHMAALGYRTSSGDTEFKCGGSLISEMFVLTAAHCCFLNGQAPHLAKIGDIKLKEFEGDIVPQRRGIAKVHEHPFYNTSMHYHDIGLLELANPIEYTYFVRPIRLWASDEIPYSKVFTMGYGSTSFAQAPTNVLTELDLTIVPLETCNQSLPRDPNAPDGIIESQICAKDFEKNRDTCQGDSGGPLQLNLERPRRRRMRYYLVGVTSYGTFCRSRYPGVYTRVSSYIDWIASIVWPAYLNRFQEY